MTFVRCPFQEAARPLRGGPACAPLEVPDVIPGHPWRRQGPRTLPEYTRSNVAKAVSQVADQKKTRNDRHSLRIPDRAEPWDSHFLVNPGSHFEVTLTVPGVYDYFCMPHEVADMVGRIVVGRPEGPGALPFDYVTGRPGTAEWRPVPSAAQKAFPSVSAIMRQRVVRRG